jgi:hypothetical protein
MVFTIRVLPNAERISNDLNHRALPTVAAIIAACGLTAGAAAQCQPRFGTPVTYPAGTTPLSIAIGDFNRDGKIDIVVSNADNSISVYLGLGGGAFSPATTYAVGSSQSNRNVVVGDFNGDGKLDLALTEYNGNRLNILMGNGDGTFQAPTSYPLGYGAAAGQVLGSGDLNRDGKPDLVSVNWGWNTISVFVSNSTGTFAAPVNYAVGNGPLDCTINDFNRDGKPDVVVANAQGNSISVLIGNGDGTLQSARTIPIGFAAVGIGSGDFNRDGMSDLVFVSDSGAMYVALGNGDGSFQSPTMIAPAGVGYSRVAIGDLNSDGKLDLVSGGSYLLGNGDGTFQSPVSLPAGGPQCAIADSDGDGRQDILFCQGGATVLLQVSSPVIAQQPSGSVVAPGQTASFSLVSSPTSGATYQWRRNGSALSDAPTGTGSVTTGVHTSTLTWSYATLADNGSVIDCVVSGGCGSVVSNPVGLGVTIPCYANCDGSSVPPILNANDFACFLNKYAAGCS